MSIPWKPISEIPKLFKIENSDIRRSKDLLVWIADMHASNDVKHFDDKSGNFARGECSSYKGDEPAFTAYGFHGDWKITHWTYVNNPNEN